MKTSMPYQFLAEWDVKNSLVSKKACVFIIHFPKKG